MKSNTKLQFGTFLLDQQGLKFYREFHISIIHYNFGHAIVPYLLHAKIYGLKFPL
jgi:hypothetical protein